MSTIRKLNNLGPGEFRAAASPEEDQSLTNWLIIVIAIDLLGCLGVGLAVVTGNEGYSTAGLAVALVDVLGLVFMMRMLIRPVVDRAIRRRDTKDLDW